MSSTEGDAAARELAQEYASELSDLTFNSKPIINNLTIIAGENLPAATEIVRVIEERLSKADSDVRLPALYLLDSIIKNVGGPYLPLFSRKIVSTFCEVFEKSNNDSTRVSMVHLLNTWEGLFPSTHLADINTRIKHLRPAMPTSSTQTAQSTSASASAPSGTSKSSHYSSQPGIHVNPRVFEERRDPFGRTLREGRDEPRRDTTDSRTRDRDRERERERERDRERDRLEREREREKEREKEREREKRERERNRERDKDRHDPRDDGRKRGRSEPEQPRPPRRSPPRTMPAPAPHAPAPPKPVDPNIAGLQSTLIGQMQSIAQQLERSLMQGGQAGMDPQVVAQLRAMQTSLGLNPAAATLMQQPHMLPNPMMPGPAPSAAPTMPLTSMDALQGLIAKVTGGAAPMPAPAAIPSLPTMPVGPFPGVPPHLPYGMGGLPGVGGFSSMPGMFLPAGQLGMGMPGSVPPPVPPHAVGAFPPLSSQYSTASISSTTPTSTPTQPPPPSATSSNKPSSSSSTRSTPASFAPPSDPRVPIAEVKVDLRAENRGVIDSLYTNMPTQCKTCGLRFLSQDKMGRHLDWHFTMNRKEKLKLKQASSRSWFVSMEEWCMYTTSDTAGESTSVPFFGQEEADRQAEELEREKEREKEKIQYLSKVVADESQPQCPVCMEKFEQSYDNDLEEWMYTGVVRDDATGMISHLRCLAPATATGPT
eukprot:TRINITY_DN5218_c0_g1_i5.p1 TRINITY_DN5218_c0_g1~~TRINITY_DN5218_c0_g1_i5.p1  ORF type:complete len:718 (+),score=131.51 TRINITY_DN5218_c0_g1_i5:28-2154(+)